MEQQIAKRAKEYARGLYPDMRDLEKTAYSDCLRDYAHGARDQHKIDIDKACEWLNSISDTFEDEYVSICGELTDGFFEDFRKAMEQ